MSMIGQKLKIIDEETLVYAEPKLNIKRKYTRDYVYVNLELKDIESRHGFSLHTKELNEQSTKHFIIPYEEEEENIKRIFARANIGRDDIYIAREDSENSDHVVLEKYYDSIEVEIRVGNKTVDGNYPGSCWIDRHQLSFFLYLGEEKYNKIIYELENNANYKTLHLSVLVSCFTWDVESFGGMDMIIKDENPAVLQSFRIISKFITASENECTQISEQESHLSSDGYEEDSSNNDEIISAIRELNHGNYNGLIDAIDGLKYTIMIIGFVLFVVLLWN